MEFDEARKELTDRYADAGLTYEREEEAGVILSYRGVSFVVTDDDINDYAACKSFRANADVTPAECSIVTPTYREQVVQPLDPIRWRYLPPLELGFTFGEPGTDEPYASVGAATMRFINAFRFDSTYMQICLERMAHAPRGGAPIDIRQGLYRPPTIRVYNLSEKSTKDALKASQAIVQYCLFELAYLKHLPVGLAEEWPARRRLEDDNFKFGAAYEGTNLPMPPADFNPDVIQFYQVGTSSRIPVLQFWAFYQVLEYFFVTASDEPLHRQLANRLKDPRFKPSPWQLDRLVQDVLDHLEVTDDVQMLTSVLERYIEAEELIAFIEQYEAYLGQEIYTKRRRLFGEDLHVRLSKDTVAENVARTIMTIRQSLVFSSDRFSRTSRGTSFDQLTEAIRPEIPLMKFLAERVIIGTAS